MKKMFERIAGAVCAAAMLSSTAVLLPVRAAEVQTARIMGDLNGDKKVTLEDAKEALDISVKSRIGLADSNATAENDAADIDMNGKIEVIDTLAIMRYFCQTLVGDQPLWSDIRKVTYHDGMDYDPYFVMTEDGPQEYVKLPFAKRGMYLEIGCASGKPGETVSVPVYLAGVEGMAGFSYFQNTPERLTLVNIRSDLSMTEVNGETQFRQFNAAQNPSDGCCTANLENGAFIWVTWNGMDLQLADGTVIAYYDYKIPEDAKAGETFVVTMDPSGTDFVDEESLEYQYTLLDGVVAVK